MPSITIRGCCIGAGRPKVILPIVARTEDDILRKARQLSRAEGRLHRSGGPTGFLMFWMLPH
mgnify:CR=1 FL=1